MPLPPDHEDRENVEMIERCKRNPYFMDMVMSMVKDTLRMSNPDQVEPGTSRTTQKQGNEILNESRILIQKTPQKQITNQTGRSKQIKSPSDTMLYASGLQCCDQLQGNTINPQQITNPFLLNNNPTIEKISEFVENIQMEMESSLRSQKDDQSAQSVQQEEGINKMRTPKDAPRRLLRKLY